MPATFPFLKARFSEGEIKHAAVVDEAFDDSAAIDKAIGTDDLWAEINDRPEWRAILDDAKIPCEDEVTFKTDGLPALWRERKQFSGELAEKINEVFIEAEANYADPYQVAEHLQSLGLTVHRIGAQPIHPAGAGDQALPTVPGEVQLVFLDYDLEGERNLEAKGGTRISELIAGKLAERKERTPFLVLFSNHPQVETLVEGFRERTGYLRGTFIFIPKEEARDMSVLCQRLSSTCVGERGLGHLQHFFFALKRQLSKVARDVESQVLQLNVQDHAFIQRLALQEEGAPLGEYMLDLFGAVLSHELRAGKEVQEAKAALDRLAFGDRHLPFSDLPSAPIQRLYEAVFTDPGIGDAEPHPRTTEGKFKDTKGKLRDAPPLLMLGDIFAKDAKSPVYVIMNPACDLQYSPGYRDPKLDLSVLLMHGILEPLDSPRSNFEGGRTEWLKFNDADGTNHWRVLWKHQQIESVPLKDFRDWKTKKGCKRIARLSLPHSLKLQQMWIATLGRVGLPVNLPIYEAFDIEIHGLDGTGKWIPLAPRLQRAAIVSRHPRESKALSHFTLTPEGRDALFGVLESAELENYPARKAAAQQLLQQHRVWNIDLTQKPLKLAVPPNDYHEDIPGLLFAWAGIPSLKGLKQLTEDEKAKLSESETKAVTKHEKVALVVVLNPPAVVPADTTPIPHGARTAAVMEMCAVGVNEARTILLPDAPPGLASEIAASERN